MIIQGVQGEDVQLDADSHVIVRLQGQQWRLSAPTSGTAVIPGAWTRGLQYYGGRRITGDVWVGKRYHAIHITPRGG